MKYDNFVSNFCASQNTNTTKLLGISVARADLD